MEVNFLSKCKDCVFWLIIGIGILCSLYTCTCVGFSIPQWSCLVRPHCDQQHLLNISADLIGEDFKQSMLLSTSDSWIEVTTETTEVDLLSDACCTSGQRAQIFFYLSLLSLSFLAFLILAVVAVYIKICDNNIYKSTIGKIWDNDGGKVLLIYAFPFLFCIFCAFILIFPSVYPFSLCIDCKKVCPHKTRTRAYRANQGQVLAAVVGHSSRPVAVISSTNTNTSTLPLTSQNLVRILKNLQDQSLVEKVINPTVLELVKKLIDETWEPSKTGKGRDAQGLTHSKIRIREVYLICNKNLTTRYNEAYNRSISRDITNVATASFKTQEVLPSNIEVTTGLFEVLMFHGTKVENLTGIVTEGFKGEKNRSSLYGKGTYLTDSAQKADQYTDTNNSRAKSELTMFVVRVALGWMVDEQFQHLDCDTVLAGKGKLFQELIVKRDELLLPQYLIVYDRV